MLNKKDLRDLIEATLLTRIPDKFNASMLLHNPELGVIKDKKTPPKAGF